MIMVRFLLLLQKRKELRIRYRIMGLGRHNYFRYTMAGHPFNIRILSRADSRNSTY